MMGDHFWPLAWHEGPIALCPLPQLLQHLLPHRQVVPLVVVKLIGERPELAVAVAQHLPLCEAPF